ncbi:MAG: CBS domain-containing protein [Halovenus sp.]
MSISEIIQEDVVTVDIDDTLLDVADVLHREQVGSAVVLNTKGEIAGVITDRDLVVYGHRYADSLEQTIINEILSMPVVSVTPGVSIEALTETMREERIRRVPVVDDGDLRGIVTLDDVVVYLAGELDNQPLRNLAAVIESESPPRQPDGLETERE